MNHPSVEEYLVEWEKQGPTARVTDAEHAFIFCMRGLRTRDVGYGWMQQIIEIEWNHKTGGHAWGPNYFEQRIKKLEEENKELRSVLVKLKEAAEMCVDYDPCNYDHHGNCQTHGIGNPCEQKVLQEAIALAQEKIHGDNRTDPPGQD